MEDVLCSERMEREGNKNKCRGDDIDDDDDCATYWCCCGVLVLLSRLIKSRFQCGYNANKGKETRTRHW